MQVRVTSVLIGFVSGILSDIMAGVIRRWLTSPWAALWPGWPWGQLKPGMSGARNLEHLVSLLGTIDAWLVSDDTHLLKQIRGNLWKQALYLSIERFTYIAVFAKSTDRRIWAVKELHGTGDPKAIEAINWIIQSPTTTDAVRGVAEKLVGTL